MRDLVGMDSAPSLALDADDLAKIYKHLVAMRMKIVGMGAGGKQLKAVAASGQFEMLAQPAATADVDARSVRVQVAAADYCNAVLKHGGFAKVNFSSLTSQLVIAAWHINFAQ